MARNNENELAIGNIEETTVQRRVESSDVALERLRSGFELASQKVSFDAMRQANADHRELTSMMLADLRARAKGTETLAIELGALRAENAELKRRLRKAKAKAEGAKKEEDSFEELLLGAIVAIGGAIGQAGEAPRAQKRSEAYRALRAVPGITQETALEWVRGIEKLILAWEDPT